MVETSTIVGQTILIKGNLEGDEDLTVQGRIEGSLNLTKTLIVEPSGVVKADVSVSNAVVSGIVVGNLTASDSVEISDTGRMVGDIQAPRVIIVEGALFKGRVDMGDLEMPRPASTAERKPAYTAKSMARPESFRRPPAPAPSRPISKKAAPPLAPPRKEEKKKEPAEPKEEARPTKKKVVVKKKR